MPELTDQMYCSEQISIPPTFPYLLRQYAKAAIRSQPIDLLQWSTAYFRCLSLNIPPPVKPRLEYPIPRDHCGITPGWLKALLYQLQNNQTISFRILWDRWTGACLSHNTLIAILCIGGFDNPDAIPWLRFIGLCAAHLSDDLTNTMKLICEIMTEEPEGGSAMIPLETFIDLYQFIARIDGSKPVKLKNTHFSDSLLSLWREKTEKDEQPKEIKEESVFEEESLVSQPLEASESEESVKHYTKEEISCPSLVGDDDYSVDYYIPEAGEEEEEEAVAPSDGFTGEPLDLYALHGEDDYEVAGEREKYDLTSENSETRHIAPEEGEKEDGGIEEHLEGELEKHVEEGKHIEEKESAGDHTIEPTAYESVDTIQEIPRKIEPDDFEDEKTLLEDLQRLKALQQEIAGETDEEVEKYKCKLIEEMPLTESQQEAIKEFQEVEVEKEPEESVKAEESEEDDKEKKHVPDEVYVDTIPGIGPVVPENLIEAVCGYMKSVSVIQHGMVMPRNIRHYNCPPLELLEY
ncbi:uncharacterized protein [Leptinotarsa decemlineata]|uniref:uncharacterized protein n=1 Tax=Leptinotarsa decemlineata TaxID=7539 RepID=UPI003D30677A